MLARQQSLEKTKQKKYSGQQIRGLICNMHIDSAYDSGAEEQKQDKSNKPLTICCIQIKW